MLEAGRRFETKEKILPCEHWTLLDCHAHTAAYLRLCVFEALRGILQA